MNAPKMTIVVAMGENRVIGRDGGMPWRLPTDLKRVKAITLGKPLVMGRRTFEAIGRPLPGRANLVVSSDPALRIAGAATFTTLEAALAEAGRLAGETGVDEYIVFGGGAIYAETIDRADRLRLTRVAAAPAGDTVFPPIDPAAFVLLHEEAMPRTERDSADALWQDFERRR